MKNKLRLSDRSPLIFRNLHVAAWPVLAIWCLSAWALGADQVKSADSSPGKVLLTNGVTCEVVGVARNPRGTNFWWKSDGTPWAEAPVKIEPLPAMSEAAPESEYLFCFRWRLPAGLAYESWKLQVVPSSMTGTAPDTQNKPAAIEDIATVAFTEHPDGFDVVELFRVAAVAARADCHVQMSFAPWEQVCIYDLDSETTKGATPGAIRHIGKPRYDKIVKALRYEITHEVSRERKDLRMVAWLRDGSTKKMVFHPGHAAGRPTVGAILSPGNESDAETLKANIKELVLEQSTWVRGKISGVALKPASN